MANVLTICGSLRKKSYNAALVRALPALAPDGMTFTAAPSVDTMPHYNHDDQEATGFPASVNGVRGRDPRGGRRDHRQPRIQLDHSGHAEERDRLGVAHEGAAVQGQAGRAAIGLAARCSAVRACSTTCASA